MIKGASDILHIFLFTVRFLGNFKNTVSLLEQKNQMMQSREVIS